MKGQKTGGRQAGTPNKITADVKAAFEEAFALIQSDKKAKLPVWGKENPGAFYVLASKLIPVKATVDLDIPDDYSIIERAARVAFLLDAARARRAEAGHQEGDMGAIAGPTDGGVSEQG